MRMRLDKRAIGGLAVAASGTYLITPDLFAAALRAETVHLRADQAGGVTALAPRVEGDR